MDWDFLQRRSPDGSQKFAMNENTNSHPQPCRPATPEELSRRRFFEKLSIGLGALCTAILGVPLVGFVLAPLFRATPVKWISVGKVAIATLVTSLAVGLGWRSLEVSGWGIRWVELAAIFVLIPVGIAIYGVGLWLLRIEGREDLEALLRKFRKR